MMLASQWARERGAEPRLLRRGASVGSRSSVWRKSPIDSQRVCLVGAVTGLTVLVTARLRLRHTRQAESGGDVATKRKPKRRTRRSRGFEEKRDASSGSSPSSSPQKSTQPPPLPVDLLGNELSPQRRAITDQVFTPHLQLKELTAGLKSGKFIGGVLITSPHSAISGMVSSGGVKYRIKGSMALNRAIDADLVVVEPISQTMAEKMEGSAKKLRHAAPREQELSESEQIELDMQDSQVPVPMAGDEVDEVKGQVVGILRRSQRELVGSLVPSWMLEGDPSKAVLENGQRVMQPADPRFPSVIVQPPPDLDESELESKRIAYVVTTWDRFSNYPSGTFSRILGTTGDPKVESEMILMEHSVDDLPFSEEVMACLPSADFKPGPDELAGREDFRNVCVFSIDPPNCEDVDDALSCEKLPNGNYRIGVHIADVTHYIKAGSPLDLEAAQRCTSVYLVERRVDMLPRLLTTDICSLRCDGKDRLTFSAVFEMTPDAEVVKQSFHKGVIKSRAALSYKEAQARLNSDPAEDSSEITEAVRQLNSLAKKLRQERFEKGALELESTELKFELDAETMVPTRAFQYDSVETNKLIEEFMLLANRAVAEEISDAWPDFGVLRRHTPPKAQGMTELQDMLSSLDFSFEYKTNKELQESLNKIYTDTDPFFNMLVRQMATRCMSRAEYFGTGIYTQPDMWPHFGLAMEKYTHFTSPIRRYADCLVHRLLAASLGFEKLPEVMQSTPDILEGVERLNYKHGQAQLAGRASVAMNTFQMFREEGPKVVTGIVMGFFHEELRVAVEEYGTECGVELGQESWTTIQDGRCVSAMGRPLTKFQGITIKVFDRVIVRLEADMEDGTYRKLKMTFLGKPTRLPDGSLAPTPQTLPEV